MNVALIGHGFWPLVGGLERQVYDCAVGLARRGCNVRVLSIISEHTDLPTDEVLHTPGNGVIQIHRAAVLQPAMPNDPLSEPEIPAGAYRQLAPRWARLLHDADVLCTFGASPALAGALIKRRLGLPFIAVLPGVPLQVDERFAEVLRCGADLFIGVSQFMCDRAATHHDLHMMPIYNGIDTDVFRPTQQVLDYDILCDIPGPLVTCPVRLDPAKGIDLLLDAFELVASLRPDATLLVTGNGSICHHLGMTNPYYEHLLRVVQLKELSHRVRFARGVFASAHMPALYTRSDVCVMTSVTEGFGLGLAESLACETPVVATRTEGMAEVFVDGEGGVYVERDASDIAQCLLTLLGDDMLRARMGCAGRQRVVSHFPLQLQADRYLALFRALCSARIAA
ncbi:MAG: glycosyltransferase family 4 protein [Gemmatimonadetes bacterium]|nr:glycosyltransferase family 4 protein [Gemmatimonadota bacterium]